MDYAKKIFPWWRRIISLGGLVHNRYSNKELHNALHLFFGDSTISDCQTAVCIPVVDVSNCQPMIFKTNNNGTQRRDLEAKLKDIALATSSAPSFFPIYSFGEYRGLLDGGLWQNNPALCGVIEACNCFIGTNKDYDSIRIMSIGNPLSGVRQSISPRNKSSGILRLREKLIFLPMKMSALGNHYILNFLAKSHALSIDLYLRIESENLPSDFNNLRLDSVNDAAIHKILERSSFDFNNQKHEIMLFFKEEKQNGKHE
jgi:patatin-like phospholipase/acyl hydrolase